MAFKYNGFAGQYIDEDGNFGYKQEDGTFSRLRNTTPINKGPITSGADPNSNSPYYIDPAAAAADPETAQGNLTRFQREDFEKRYLPIENEIIDRSQGNGEAEADAAGERASQQLTLTRKQFFDNINRAGVGLSPEERASAERKFSLANATSVANAENTTRRNVESRNIDLQGDIIGIGKGITAGAGSGLSTATNLQLGREAAGDAARAADKQQTYQTVSTAAGLGLALYAAGII